jgi:hypothetical protein
MNGGILLWFFHELWIDTNGPPARPLGWLASGEKLEKPSLNLLLRYDVCFPEEFGSIKPVYADD